jgi:tetratricopeptide (TPR) repeat protein
LLGAGGTELDKRIKGLRRYSLIQAKDGMVSSHRLLQQIVREKLSTEEQHRYAEHAVQLVDRVFPDPDDPKNLPTCAKLLPHALSTTGFAEGRQIGLEAAAHLLNRMGFYQWQLGRLPDALALYERSLWLAVKIYGNDSAEVGIRANNIGRVLNSQGDPDGALSYAQFALEIDEKVYGADHPDVAIDISNIGQILQDQGDLDGALRCTQRALAIDEKFYGPDHPAVATRVNNIGQILRDLGDLDGALSYTQRALAISQRVSAPDHPNIATFLNNIGLILRDQGKLDDALPFYERGFRLLASVFGPDHPNTKTVADNLRILQQEIAARDAAQ